MYLVLSRVVYADTMAELAGLDLPHVDEEWSANRWDETMGQLFDERYYNDEEEVRWAT